MLTQTKKIKNTRFPSKSDVMILRTFLYILSSNLRDLLRRGKCGAYIEVKNLWVIDEKSEHFWSANRVRFDFERL